jgi:hypothetical protein
MYLKPLFIIMLTAYGIAPLQATTVANNQTPSEMTETLEDIPDDFYLLIVLGLIAAGIGLSMHYGNLIELMETNTVQPELWP